MNGCSFIFVIIKSFIFIFSIIHHIQTIFNLYRKCIEFIINIIWDFLVKSVQFSHFLILAISGWIISSFLSSLSPENNTIFNFFQPRSIYNGSLLFVSQKSGFSICNNNALKICKINCSSPSIMGIIIILSLSMFWSMIWVNCWICILKQNKIKY